MLNIARTAQDIRITAGARGATAVFAIGTHRTLTAAELASVDRNTGRLEVDRERLSSDVDQIGNPDRLAKAMKDAIESYFGLVNDQVITMPTPDNISTLDFDSLLSSIELTREILDETAPVLSQWDTQDRASSSSSPVRPPIAQRQ